MNSDSICTSENICVNKLPMNLYRYCREIAKKNDLLCVYKTVKKTDKYRNRNFVLNSKSVIPEIYTGVWFDPGLWDHRSGGDFWYTTNAKIFVIAKVGEKFYVPTSSSFKWEEIDQHDLEDDGIDLINDKRLTSDYVLYYDKVEEQILNDDVELTELYHKVKLNDELLRCIKKYCYEKNFICVYSGVKEISPDSIIYRSKYYCGYEVKIQPTKIYEVPFFDKNSKVVSNGDISYDILTNYIIEDEENFYTLIDMPIDNLLFQRNKKFMHIVNKNHLLPTKITKIGNNLILAIKSVNNLEQL